MGRISENTIEKIIQSNNIVDIISEFVPLKKTGRNYMGVCPFHNDKGPSLSVSPEKGVFHCFGCGASGNTVGFIMKIRNMDYIDAVKYLGEKAGISIEEDEKNPRLKAENKLKDIIYSINIEAARFFFTNMINNQIPRQYFKDRNIDEVTIKRFGLGYSINSWDSLLTYLRSKGYKEELILKAGLIIRGKNGGYYDRFRNRVMFPVFDVKGRVIGFGGRVLDDSKPKYLNSPETPVFHKGINLYGLNFAVKGGIPDYLIIVEGYMDCISLHESGITNVVASLGTALTLEQGKLLKKYCRDVYICYDADSAGKTATLRGLEILEECGMNVKIISIPRGKDPDEYVKTHGRDAFLKLIKESQFVTEYRILRAKDGKNLKEIKDKSDFVKEVAGILSRNKSEIEIQAYVSKIYDETSIDSQAILDEIKRLKGNTNIKEYNNEEKRYNNKSGNIYNLEPGYKKAEKYILRYIVSDTGLFEYVSEKINEDEFITKAYRIAAKEIFQSLRGNENISPQDILIKFNNELDISNAASIFQEIEIPDNVQLIIDDLIRTIKKYNLEQQINDIALKIKNYEDNNEIEKSAALTQEFTKLMKQLKLL